MKPYEAPWFFKNGLVQTILVSLHHGNTWIREGENSSLAPKLPPVPWQEQTFRGAEGVPIAGRFARQPQTARATLVLCYGITGMMDTSWYTHYLARKAYAQGYDVVLYDWRGHGRTAQLSPVPPSDGWRDGEDIVCIARQAHVLGCARHAIPVGFSLGGQLVLWSLKAAVDLGETAILGACTICPNLQSTWSLDNLRTTLVGRTLEAALVKDLRCEVKRRLQYYPETVPPGILERVNYISEFDDEMVIDYYGFSSVEDYYKQTSGLYLLEELKLPHLILYAEDDPMFDPRILPELRRRSGSNPQATLVITPHGGHVGYVGFPDGDEDEFWALNRVLEYCDQLVR